MTELDEQVALTQEHDEINSNFEQRLHPHGHTGFGAHLMTSKFILVPNFRTSKCPVTNNTRLEHVKVACGCINPTPAKKLCGSHLAVLFHN